MRGCRHLLLLVTLPVLPGPCPASSAATPANDPQPLIVSPARSPIAVDGVLDECAWQGAARIVLGYETDPGENTPARVATECWLTYDARALYVAFRAHDPDPATIRAHLSDRDDSFRDDIVGFFIDPFDDQQRAFEFVCNPVGVQMDATFNQLEHEAEEDFSWDAIWSSAGRVTGEGYQVEMAIPLTTLRFPPSTTGSRWRFEPFRARPRTVRRITRASPVDRSSSCALCQHGAITLATSVKPGHNVEIAPTLTAHDARRQEEPLAGPWLEDRTVELGLSARWGVTPNLSLNLALNPDFSQVEADAIQLDVNERFALFYPEKRPFFQEGFDYFTTPLEVVYTRTVTDPDWGAKLSGKEGRHALGIIAAEDAVTSLLLPGHEESRATLLDQESQAGVLRYRVDIAPGSTIGAVITGREGDGYSNLVFGADAFLRFGDADTVSAQLLRSQTEYPESVVAEYGQPEAELRGTGIDLVYGHSSRDWQWWAEYRNLDEGFRADWGFLPRVDLRTMGGGAEYRLWGEDDDWYTRLSFAAMSYRTEDHADNLSDESHAFELRGWGPLQSSLYLRLENAKERFADLLHSQNKGNLFFNIRPTGDFTCSVRIIAGDAIDYANLRPARRLLVGPGLTYNVGRHVFIQLDHDFEDLEVSAGRLYRANLLRLRLMYNFNPRSFVRAIIHAAQIERDPELYRGEVERRTRKLFTQLLFSYKVNPQTLVFLGYSDNHLGEGGLDLTRTDRTIFLKLGYVWLW